MTVFVYTVLCVSLRVNEHVNLISCSECPCVSCVFSGFCLKHVRMKPQTSRTKGRERKVRVAKMTQQCSSSCDTTIAVSFHVNRLYFQVAFRA